MARPRTPLIDLARITSSAFELIDEHGEFSLPQIARRLGVQTASLYHHVDGRDGVIELIREHISYAIDSAAIDAALAGQLPWDRALATWARSYRTAFAAHPRAIPLLMATPIRTPRVLDQYEHAVRMMLDAGFALPDVVHVITALESLILGCALDLTAPASVWETSGETPTLARAVAAASPARADAAFELALAGCLNHFKTLIVPAPAHADRAPGDRDPATTS